MIGTTRIIAITLCFLMFFAGVALQAKKIDAMMNTDFELVIMNGTGNFEEFEIRDGRRVIVSSNLAPWEDRSFTFKRSDFPKLEVKLGGKGGIVYDIELGSKSRVLVTHGGTASVW